MLTLMTLSIVFYCPWMYLSLNAEALKKIEKHFIYPGSQFKTAAPTYASHIHEMGVHHANTISNYLPLSHFSLHGVWQESGTHAATATMTPPLFTPIVDKVNVVWVRF